MQESAELDPEYRKISRERNRIAATKTRTAQVIDARSVNARTAYTQTYANKRKARTPLMQQGRDCILNNDLMQTLFVPEPAHHGKAW